MACIKGKQKTYGIFANQRAEGELPAAREGRSPKHTKTGYHAIYQLSIDTY